jgi:multiple sugar transport system permease protein
MFSAYGTFFLRQFFLSLPGELEEAAIIDGCSRFGIYWRILLPLCGTALAAFSLFTVLWAWNDLMWPLIVTSKESVRVLSVGIATLQGQYTTRNNYLMAACCMATAPMIVVFILLQKQFISGIATIGIKV